MSKKMLRVNGKGLYPLSDDAEWGIALFCYPNTKLWRGVIRGVFTRLGSGWTYKNCDYGEVARIGRMIGGSLDMDCKVVLEDIRDCICRIATVQEGLGLDTKGSYVVNETACLRAKSAVSMAYFWAMQLSKVKSGIMSLAGPLFTSSSPLSLLDDILADGWAKDSVGTILEGVVELFIYRPIEFFGVEVPQYEVRDDTDYKGLMELIEDNQAVLIQSIYESCTPSDAKAAFDAAVDSLDASDWKSSYLKTIISEAYLEASFDGSLSKLYEVSGVGDWITYECVGNWPCEDCVIGNGPVLGSGFTNWDSVLGWSSGVVTVTAQQDGDGSGPNLPYQIKLEIEGGGVVRLSSLDGEPDVTVTTHNQDCDIVSTSLWDGVGSYTTPAGSSFTIKNNSYPFSSYDVGLEVIL